MEVVSFILIVVAFVAGDPINRNDYEIAHRAILDETLKYDEQFKISMRNGAQLDQEPATSSNKSVEIGRISNIFRNAYTKLVSSYNMRSSTAVDILKDNLPAICLRPKLACDPNGYRSYNGSCNNLKNPHWGKAYTPQNRLLPPAYENFDKPRGSSLPSPRKLSLGIHSGNGFSFEASVTHMVAQFGQFLDHDITLTSFDGYNCCGNATLEDCFPIGVESTDPFYKGRRSCINFIRSTPACFPSEGDELRPREQLNLLSAYIDGSVIYGSDNELAYTLRSKVGGKLVENSEYPGIIPWKSDVGLVEEKERKVIAGDARAAVMPGTAVMQSLFLREHNRIAGEFGRLRPDWDDEKIYQETRRIIGAELQQIAYNEFLPAVFGEGIIRHGLSLPENHDDFTEYDENVDASILNEFSTAAYRFGHTLVNGLIQLYLRDIPIGSYRLRDNYFKVENLIEKHPSEKSGFYLILNGLLRQRAQAFDCEIHEDLSNYLFPDVVEMIGSDLTSRNIQRGRDHGIPSYNEFRKFCNLKELTDWAQKPEEIEEESWKRLASVYEGNSPTEIDLYSGGLAEKREPGGLAGPTFLCIMAEQFKRLMKGDRFFYTHENQTGSFTREQLVQLRGRTLGDIICENSDLEETTRNVFYLGDYGNSTRNPMIKCGDKRRMQFNISAFIPK